ncbi:hypothetical protein NQ317_003252 [Molorchus minor]|uniref:Uncharacterized protein n=1 Tax=Molorchus minor TaxID=1323400 RepID=A0ABQ9J7C4_9CUCU|nr:hypothetical protein NQ317_003252 [Molorchus minor]
MNALAMKAPCCIVANDWVSINGVRGYAFIAWRTLKKDVFNSFSLKNFKCQNCSNQKRSLVSIHFLRITQMSTQNMNTTVVSLKASARY